jgi:hypothetical protein
MARLLDEYVSRDGLIQNDMDMLTRPDERFAILELHVTNGDDVSKAIGVGRCPVDGPIGDNSENANAESAGFGNASDFGAQALKPRCVAEIPD